MRICRISVGACLIFCMTATTVLAGGMEANSEPADPVAALHQALRDDSAVDLIMALRAVGQSNDGAALEQGKVVETILDIITDRTRLNAVQTEALQTLDALLKKGFDPLRVLAALTGIAKDPDAPPLVRERALMLIGNHASVLEDGPIYRAAYHDLENLWKSRKRSRLPRNIQRKLLNSIGAFHRIGEGVQALLLDGLEAGVDADSVDIKVGALNGLEQYIHDAAVKDPDLVKTLLRLLEKEETHSARASALRCLQQLDRNTVKIDSKRLRELVLSGLESADGEEVRAVLGLAKRVPDTEIVRAMVNGFGRGPRVYDAETLQAFCKALADCFRFLRESKDDDAAAKTASEVVQVFLAMLADPDIPLQLKHNAAIGLGCIPTAFDRRPAAAGLIRELKRQTSEELKTTIEASLVYLTGARPRQTLGPDGTVPDPGQWAAWLEKKAESLAPGNPPAVEEE